MGNYNFYIEIGSVILSIVACLIALADKLISSKNKSKSIFLDDESSRFRVGFYLFGFHQLFIVVFGAYLSYLHNVYLASNITIIFIGLVSSVLFFFRKKAAFVWALGVMVGALIHICVLSINYLPITNYDYYLYLHNLNTSLAAIIIIVFCYSVCFANIYKDSISREKISLKPLIIIPILFYFLPHFDHKVRIATEFKMVSLFDPNASVEDKMRSRAMSFRLRAMPTAVMSSELPTKGHHKIINEIIESPFKDQLPLPKGFDKLTSEQKKKAIDHMLDEKQTPLQFVYLKYFDWRLRGPIQETPPAIGPFKNQI
ncbi:MAG: hypothetical protein KJ630_17215 [Proteobacteria bacterium]|nr:hypothetical protein [Pseudomonadota bacterium]